jgi:hypothetical protein
VSHDLPCAATPPQASHDLPCAATPLKPAIICRQGRTRQQNSHLSRNSRVRLRAEFANLKWTRNSTD